MRFARLIRLTLLGLLLAVRLYAESIVRR